MKQPPRKRTLHHAADDSVITHATATVRLQAVHEIPSARELCG